MMRVVVDRRCKRRGVHLSAQGRQTCQSFRAIALRGLQYRNVIQSVRMLQSNSLHCRRLVPPSMQQPLTATERKNLAPRAEGVWRDGAASVRARASGRANTVRATPQTAQHGRPSDKRRTNTRECNAMTDDRGRRGL